MPYFSVGMLNLMLYVYLIGCLLDMARLSRISLGWPYFAEHGSDCHGCHKCPWRSELRSVRGNQGGLPPSPLDEGGADQAMSALGVRAFEL